MDHEKDKKTPLIGPGNGATSTEPLENSSPAELADALENMLNASTEESYDPDLVTAYLDALEKKAPMPQPPDAQSAEADFRRRLGTLKPTQETQPTKRRRHRFPVTVAATMALLFALMLCVQAAGFDIFGGLARWSAETFHFAQPEAQVSPYYEPLKQVLEENKILGELAPKWYPEGFVTLGPEVEQSKLAVTVSAEFQSQDEKRFTITFTWRPDLGEQGQKVYEKEDTPVEVYTHGERSFYLFANSKNTTWAVWSAGGLEESIRGELSVDEVKKIIDSIGGSP